MANDIYSDTPPIFIVTTMILDASCPGTWRDRRPWGWHPSKELAFEAVIENDGDIFEWDYTHAVVESVLPGTFAQTVPGALWWFQASREGGNVTIKPCQEPPGMEGISGFGLG